MTIKDRTGSFLARGDRLGIKLLCKLLHSPSTIPLNLIRVGLLFGSGRWVLGLKLLCKLLHSPSTIPLEIWFAWGSFLARGGGFWKSNFYVSYYTLLLPYFLKFDSRGAPFWLREVGFGNQTSKTLSFYHTSWNLIRGSLLLGSKRWVLGIKLLWHSPSTIPLELLFPRGQASAEGHHSGINQI